MPIRDAFPGLRVYRPNPQSMTLHRAIEYARFPVVLSGSRAGKTWAVSHDSTERICRDIIKFRDTVRQRKQRWPYLRYWFVAPTTELTDEMRDVFFMIIGGINDRLHRWEAKTQKLWFKHLPLMIHFKSVHNLESIKAVGCNGIVADEMPSMKKGVLSRLMMRLTDRVGWMIMDGTPEGRNWYYRDVLKAAMEGDKKYHYVKFTTVGNVAAPELVAEALEMKKYMTERDWKREFEGDVSSFTGLVFPEFDPDKHIVAAVPPARLALLKTAGIDWGWSAPGAFEAIRFMNPAEGFSRREIYVHDEHYAERTHVLDDDEVKGDTWESIIRRVHERDSLHRVYGDPEEPENIAALSRRFQNSGKDKLIIRSAILPKKDSRSKAGSSAYFARSISLLAKLLEVDRLFIGQDCPGLRDNFLTWEFKEDEETPKRGNDHGIDAVRYGVLDLLRMTHERYVYRIQQEIPHEHISGITANVRTARL